MKIASLQGPWSVGKSTLLHSLKTNSALRLLTKKEFGENERRERDQHDFDLSDPRDFVRNQEIFFRGELNRYNSFKDLTVDYLILDRGPEDTLCFTEIHSIAIGAKWDIREEIQRLRAQYMRYESDLIIYLYAELQELRRRRSADTCKTRRNYDKYLELYYTHEFDFFQNQKNTVFVDTTNMTPKELYERVLDLLKA